jgi:hypothetical protein
MERRSDTHGPRLDDALEHEAASLTHGAPIESRADPGREMEGVTDDEPRPDVISESALDDEGPLSRAAVRARSELAQHLRPSIFPARRDALVACAREEDAPVAMIQQLERLSASMSFANVEQVWEALGGHREERAAQHERHEEPRADARIEPETMAARRFDFHFDRMHRLLALPFGISPGSAFVEIDLSAGRLTARFGRWCVETPLANVVGACVTGPYWTPKTAGPPRLSLADRGLTFATNDVAGVCIQFEQPVRGVEPVGLLRHPGLTVTVTDPEALRDLLVSQIR